MPPASTASRTVRNIILQTAKSAILIFILVTRLILVTKIVVLLYNPPGPSQRATPLCLEVHYSDNLRSYSPLRVNTATHVASGRTSAVH